MRNLDAERLFGFARGNKHSKLLTLFWNVVGRERNRKILGFRAVSGGLQHLHDFVEGLLSCSDMPYVLTENFDSKGMAQGNDQIRIFLFFQLSHQFLVPFGGKLAGVVLRDGFHGFALRCVKQNNGDYVSTK